MDIASLMWDETGRDYEHEQHELSRTAALADAERLVGEFVYRADNDIDLINRLALAEPQLQAIASERLYPMGKLTGDLTQRWRLLSQARASAVRHEVAAREVTAAQEQAMDSVTAQLAALAARENPRVPLAECLTLAAEAVRKHADAYPLAYESWGGAADGAITQRVKNWRPPGLPGQESGERDPGPDGGSSTFDEVSNRLDDLESRVGSSTTASLEPTVAGFFQRLKDWWQSPSDHPTDHPTSDLMHGFDQARSEMDRKWDANAAGPGASEEYTTRHRSDDLLHGFDQARSEMNRKWDANAASPGASPEYTTQHASDDLLHGFDKARSEMAEKWDANLAGPGASENHRPPVPGGFSHAETGAGHGGQAPLPTDPSEHGFSHPETSHTPRQRTDGLIPSHFQYSAVLFE